MNFKHTIVFIAPLLCMSGCQVQTASRVVELADNLFKLLNSFAEASKNHQESVNQSTQKAKGGLEPQESSFPIPIPGITSSGEVNLVGIADEWEKNMQTMLSRTSEMTSKLNDVKSSSDKYWSKIEEITGEIKNPEIQLREREKNKKLKIEWDVNYGKAESQVNRAVLLNTKAQDLHKVMTLSSMRQKISTQMNQLQDISNEADNIFREIKEVTQKGQEIIRKQEPKS